MKNAILILLVFAGFISSSFKGTLSDSYDITYIFEKYRPEGKMYAVSAYNNISDVDYLLIESEIDEGTYEVSVSSLEDGIFHIDGTDLYLELNLCYQVCYGDDAILKVESNYGYFKGSITFID